MGEHNEIPMNTTSKNLNEALINEAIDPELLKSFFKRHVELERHLNKIYELDLDRKIEIENATLLYLTIE